MKPLLPIILLLLALSACRSVKETATTQKVSLTARADTQKTTSALRDTLLFHDSIYIKEWQRGDTVFLTRNTVSLRYRDRWRTDTFYKAATDTVRVTDYAWREKEAGKPWWAHSLLLAIGGAAVSLAIVAGLFLIMLRREG